MLYKVFIFSLLAFSFSSYMPVPAVSDFSLKNIDGKIISLQQYPDAKGFIIIFTCNHCPFAQLYPQRLNLLQKKYTAKGVPLIAISSMDTAMYAADSYTEMIQKAEKEGFTFPYLYDADQSVAKNFGAEKTPEAFVIWKENGKWVVKYRGAIDDNGAFPEKVKEKYVEKAVNTLLKGKTVSIAETKSIGCKIYYR